MSDGLHVIGGLGGVEVEYDDLAAMAKGLQSAALQLAETACAAQTVVVDAGLLTSSALDPCGFTRVEAAVMSAVTGPHGVLAAAASLEHQALTLTAAVLRYQAADRLGTGLRDLRQWSEGVAAAVALPLLPLLPLLAVSDGGLAASLLLRGKDADAFLAEHPGLVEDAAGASPAFLDTVLLGLQGVPLLAPLLGIGPGSWATSVDDAAGTLAGLYPSGSAVVIGRGTDRSAPPAPRGVGDLLAGLDHRDQRSRGEAQGEIDIRRMTRAGPGGTTVTSWIVDIPGTKAWQFDPRHREHLNDLATNLTTMAGEPTARIDGLALAMEQAGIGAKDPVMLVGHSQGGLVAMRAAEAFAASGRFHVTHVVTAGSPTARMPVPASVSVLSLENRYDVVPQLDGAPSPPDPNRVTVVFDAQHHDVGSNHAMSTTYVPAARAVDGDAVDGSLAGWREGAAAFLATDGVATHADTTVWDIRNQGCG